MTTIQERLEDIRKQIPEHVKLVAVSKTKPNESILEAYHAGQRVFGENKVQELCQKQEVLPADIEWHLIGHLQTNKVKYIAPFVHLIHAVDSLKLLQEINKQGEKNGRVISCLLQFHIAQEDTKFGLSFEEAEAILNANEFVEMQFVSITGIMGMASNTDDEEQVRDEFRTLHNYFQIIKSKYFKFNDEFREISMGMSGDFLLAIEEGSTMVRVGSSIFGDR
ncbi:MAG: YggS family pyridoxal phosphate-dependent enzyme [Fluviicola sp.]